eukprot:TRINITY_DN50596_c0_g1_i1.p2 TRINITY_DN50596_c0_g1~~TRINITY_DN50596_c0_g1_i1.p2  ORF type:complete len:108 (+),score=29.95 TRINITY_DN50596_c0_g1_i1:394-717(+)
MVYPQPHDPPTETTGKAHWELCLEDATSSFPEMQQLVGSALNFVGYAYEKTLDRRPSDHAEFIEFDAEKSERLLYEEGKSGDLLRMSSWATSEHPRIFELEMSEEGV